MNDRLSDYRRKRDAQRTPEPVPPDARPAANAVGNRFVIHQHHARSLHWDLRLERDGVLASWAVPRGVPRDPARNHLAVHTEDHPLEYLDFAGTIPAGEYGGGRMLVYDTGTYDTEKWRDDEVLIVLHGSRVSGRYVLFQTSGKDWMMHRMEPPPPGWEPMPSDVSPMRAYRAKRLPANDADWAFELEWPGERSLAAVSGGRLEISPSRPELRPLGSALAPTECLIDGVVVSFGPDGAVRRSAPESPVQYLVFDLLWLDGKPTVQLPYTARRDLLLGLELNGPNWQTPPHFVGGGRFALDTAREQGLPGVVAKRLDSAYVSGGESRDWRRLST
jgi:bifunctional non-homologous end joining protein LigD